MVKHLKTMCLTTAAFTVLVAGGCQSSHPTESDTATSKAEITETATLEHTQGDAGARAECTLYADHFDGNTLSNLGTTFLDRILADSHSCNPLNVYLDIPDDNMTQDRRLAVGRYLADRGSLKPDQIVFHSGTNPANLHPAGPDLANYAKTDTAADSGGAPAAGGSTGH